MWIYDHPTWPNFTWDQQAVSTPLATVRYKQGRLLGRMEGFGFDLRQEASLLILTSDVLTSSAIEGEILNQAEVRSSIARRLGLEIAGLVPVSRNVEGIVDMMLDATQNFQNPLTAKRLYGWHAALFPTGRSGLHKITVGAWRTEDAEPMLVVSGPMGRERIHFEAPSAQRLRKEMDQFLNWTQGQHKEDPVIEAAIAHLWFVTIHAFEDGNGRIARAIADMMLARADGVKDRFYSMSAGIEAERKEYYDQLEQQQRGTPDITSWLLWFLACLDRAITKADDVLTGVLYKVDFWRVVNTDPVNDRQKMILNKMLNDFTGHMNTSKYAAITKCSHDTALRDMRELVQRKIFVQNTGGGRSTSYRLASLHELNL